MRILLALGLALNPVSLTTFAADPAHPAPVREDRVYQNPLSAELKKVHDDAQQRRRNRWPAKTWTIAYDAEAFVKLAMSCLSTPDSSISPSGKKLTVIDEPRCAKDIEAASKKWNPSLPASAVHIPKARKRALKEKLRGKFGKPDAIQTLSSTAHCPCWIFTGPKHADAAAFLNASLASGATQPSP